LTRCSFAFVDFTSIEHATEVLVNPKNYLLNGRKLVVEYASADAVRRGAPKTKREDGGAERMPYRRKEAKSRGPRAEKKLQRERTAGDGTASSAPKTNSHDRAAPSSTTQDAESGGTGRERERKGPKNRPKPGAALALAKRESAAIVPSQGKKVVF
jgi:RNA recognition motif-containing protein